MRVRGNLRISVTCKVVGHLSSLIEVELKYVIPGFYDLIE